jgi:hypothetical protein
MEGKEASALQRRRREEEIALNDRLEEELARLQAEQKPVRVATGRAARPHSEGRALPGRKGSHARRREAGSGLGKKPPSSPVAAAAESFMFHHPAA